MQLSFTTDRLLLVPLTESENTFIYELLNTEGWIKFIGNRNINTNEDAAAYIQKIINNPNVTYWVVKTKESATPIGLITLIKRDYLEYSDIGFAFLPQFADKGYAFEASNVVLKSTLERYKDSPVLAITIPENIASIKLLKKLEFQFEKEIEVEKEVLHMYSSLLPQKVIQTQVHLYQ